MTIVWTKKISAIGGGGPAIPSIAVPGVAIPGASTAIIWTEKT